MLHATILLFLRLADLAAPNVSGVAWPFHVNVTSLDGRTVMFRAVSLGGDLIFQVPERDDHRPAARRHVQLVKSLARRDTLTDSTPARYALDLRRGPVRVFTLGRDSVAVAVTRTDPRFSRAFDNGSLVAARGRHLTVRLVNDVVVIDTR
jgi:hypothetical protein